MLCIMNTPLEKAISVAGGQVALGRAIGVSQQRISWWLNKCAGRVPAEFCVPIERATGVSKHDLRADVFGPTPTTPAEAA
jgi:DNA-binding transcriptional regulator YdaS (Cro superfamily)